MGQTTLILMIITVISKIFGFVRESVMAAYIGAGELKSIYTTSMTIPLLITGVIVGGIKSAYIPVFNKVKNEKGLKEAIEFTSNLINLLMIYGLISIIIIFIFAEPLSKLFSPDLSGSSLSMAASFSRILSLTIFMSLYSSVISGYLNIHGNFIDPSIIGFINNAVVITSTILYAKTKNPYILIIGTFIGLNIQFIRYPFASKKLGFKYSRKFNRKDPYIKYLLVLILPIVLSSAAVQLSNLVDNSMASAFFGVASVSKIFYARTMLNFITGVVTLSISTVTFPEIAKLGQSGDTYKMRKYLSTAVVIAMLLVIPATLGMMTLSEPIIKVAFERNAFLNSDTVVVSKLLVAYGPSIIFESSIQIITNAFYSIGDSKTPVKVVIFQQVMNIILNIILSRIFGLTGLALATTLSTILAAIFLIYGLNKQIGKTDSKTSSLSIIKILLASIIMCFVAIVLYKYFISISNLYISLFLSVAVAGIIYLLIIIFIKIPEVDDLINSIKNKLRKNKWEEYEY